MLVRFFRRLFGLGEFRTDVYHPRDRMIYCYFDGQQEVAADPLLLYRSMMDVGPELSINIKVANSPMKDAGAAHVKMLEQIRGIFGVRPYEQGKGGLTEHETVSLLDHFLLYCSSIKKNMKPSVTSSVSPAAASADSPAAPPPTPSISDSGSIAAGLSTAPPPPPPSGPVSPSV